MLQMSQMETIAMNPKLECAECGKPIESDAVWFTLGVAMQPTDNHQVSDVISAVSTTDNGGLPYHRTCLEEQHRRG